MIEKKFLKSKPICKVKFSLPKSQVQAAKTVTVVGDFNNWDISATPLKKQKTGNFAATIDLDIHKEYQFRYVLDGKEWINDEEADRFVPANIGSEQNGLLSI
ncbi:isoamylase early set domain-containing protein [Marinomonas sp. 15G1-11]|uniref:Isoamylase early set domain-containing protein n=1 Tax=Marinomonas phaeophyticola TaxID=3004091 RepID=A0ABT4JSH5_9GAMM|nr:isoamylase early set domain-containing protein [Marinomonas sp. 15G1-11]MCZ2721297.1 isoamylase early set domain-containing protein [Marinomonas sp. 15G1-11]